MRENPTILILGDKGRLGRTIINHIENNNIGQVVTFPHRLPNPEAVLSLESLLNEGNIDLVINCIAYTNVEKAEMCRAEAKEANSTIPLIISSLIKDLGDIELWHFSTDYVFDGEGSTAFKETHPTNPINYYGKSKRDGEENVARLAQFNPCKIFRVSSLYYPNFWSLNQTSSITRLDFVQKMVYLSETYPNETVAIPIDQYTIPTNALAVVSRIFEMIRVSSGVYHPVQQGFCSWFEYATNIVKHFDLHLNIVPRETRSDEVVKRPRFSVLHPSDNRHYYNIPPMRHWKEEFLLAYPNPLI